MTFGEKLKLCRKLFDVTQDELSARVGSSKQVISRYESGQRVPKVTNAAKYAEALDIPLALLIDDSIPFVVWDDESYFEDYYEASDLVRIRIVEKLGLDPRIASDYGTLLSESSVLGRNAVFDDPATLDILAILSDFTPEEMALAKSRILKIKESR